MRASKGRTLTSIVKRKNYWPQKFKNAWRLQIAIILKATSFSSLGSTQFYNKGI